jgi:hypothetical protein
MEFKAGDKVKRKTYDMDYWWNDICEDANVKPDHVFTVSEFVSMHQLYLEGFKSNFDSFRFELVSSPTDMESEYQRALKLVDKKIVVGRDKHTVQNVLFRRGNDRDDLMSFETLQHLNQHGWVVSVVFDGRRNLPVSMVKEVPSDLSVELNGSYTAVISKDGVKVGCQTFPIEKIQEIIDTYNKL